MARPSKNNAEYFSHDADMRNNRKVKALRRRFSHKGYAVWCFILETLTDADYFEIKFDEVTQDLLAADFDITNEELQSIVAYCVKIRLLQMKDDTLYCEALKQRFSGLLEKRRYNRDRLEALRKKHKNAVTTTDNNDNCCDNNSTKTGDNDNCCDNNSTVKYSIENNSKVKESKEKKIKKKEEYKYSSEKEIEKNGFPAKAENLSDKSDAEKKEIDFKKILEFFNEEMEKAGAAIPKIKLLSEDRKNHIRARIREYGRAAIDEMIITAAHSDFLNGRNNNGWIADFSWLIRPCNFPKVLEGNYNQQRQIERENGIYRQDSKDRRTGDEVQATSAEDYKTTF